MGYGWHQSAHDLVLGGVGWIWLHFYFYRSWTMIVQLAITDRCCDGSLATAGTSAPATWCSVGGVMLGHGRPPLCYCGSF